MKNATITRAPFRRSANKAYGRSSPLLPQAVRDFLRQRLIDAGALSMIGLAAAICLALASYDHADPSLNTSTGRLAANLLGSFGSYCADFLLSGFGFVAGLLPVTLAAWGSFVLIRRPLRHWALRIIALLICLTSGSLLFSFLPSTMFNTAGGSLGFALHHILMQSLAPTIGVAALPVIVFVAAGLCVPLLIAMLGFTLTEWGKAASTGMNVSKATAARAQDFAQALSRRQGDAADESIAPATVRPDLFPASGLLPKHEKRKAAAARRPHAEPSRGSEPDFLTGGDYSLPPLHLMQLAPAAKIGPELSREALNATSAALASVLQDFGVKGDIVRINPGPVVTLYELEPAPGTKSARVIGLADDIARSLSAVSVRVAVVPGRNAIGIELPNQRRETVFMREVLESETYQQATNRLPLMLGKEIGGQPIVADLARMPHLLVAGTTGSGKSVAINTMILSLLYRLSPDQCKFIMVDPKMLELSVYDGIPHLLTPVVTEPKKAVVALKWTVREMEDRYRNMSKLGVRNIDGYNARLKEARETGEVLTRKVQTGFDPDTGKPVFEDQSIDLVELPYIVVVVDEFADLMLVAGKDIEAAIQRLAQMARAAGIHLIMATQRPSVDVITGTIKANFPTRISFAVSSRIDSRTILNESGAEQLLGQGDMLYMATGGRITRIHGPFVRDDEVEHIVAFLKKQGEPQYIDAVTEDDGSFGDGEDGGAFDTENGSGDELYDKAVALVARERKASTSFVQRHFQVGYNKAARLIERMEKEGVVSTANHVGKREVLVRSTRDED